MSNEGEVYFALCSEVDFDPCDITRVVGLEPSRTTRRAFPRPKYTSWKVSSGKVETDVIDIYAMSSALISRLRAHSDKIVQAKRQFGLTAYLEVVLWISVDETTSTPAIGFDAEVISFLNAVGAHIDVDTYINTA